jgi:catechol 2,3-dioxygenase-like lactoylglutathione lyase family enzyme
MAIELRRVHHVSLNVVDLAAAERFYCGALELPRLPRPDFGFDGVWLDAGEQQIHLIAVDDFEAPVGQHFAFEVDDIDATIAELRQRGVEVSDPTQVGDVCRQAFLRDPTGNVIELNQPTS